MGFSKEHLGHLGNDGRLLALSFYLEDIFFPCLVMIMYCLHSYSLLQINFKFPWIPTKIKPTSKV